MGFGRDLRGERVVAYSAMMKVVTLLQKVCVVLGRDAPGRGKFFRLIVPLGAPVMVA